MPIDFTYKTANGAWIIPRIWDTWLNAFISRKRSNFFLKIIEMPVVPGICGGDSSQQLGWHQGTSSETDTAAPAVSLLVVRENNQGLLPIVSTEEKHHLWDNSGARRICQICPSDAAPHASKRFSPWSSVQSLSGFQRQSIQFQPKLAVYGAFTSKASNSNTFNSCWALK